MSHLEETLWHFFWRTCFNGTSTWNFSKFVSNFFQFISQCQKIFRILPRSKLDHSNRNNRPRWYQFTKRPACLGQEALTGFVLSFTLFFIKSTWKETNGPNLPIWKITAPKNHTIESLFLSNDFKHVAFAAKKCHPSPQISLWMKGPGTINPTYYGDKRSLHLWSSKSALLYLKMDSFSNTEPISTK